jgi:hypothetical protein
MHDQNLPSFNTPITLKRLTPFILGSGAKPNLTVENTMPALAKQHAQSRPARIFARPPQQPAQPPLVNNGTTIPTPARILGYSLTDQNANPLDLTAE